MNHIYCISGLGADYRIFQNLKLNNAEMHYISWVVPEKEDDMRGYALRLISQIKHQRIILMGVSYGGMLASELTQVLSSADSGIVLQKTILISSCKNREELPDILKFCGKINFHKVIPFGFFISSKMLTKFLFDLQSKQEELYLKQMMLSDCDVEFIKRSIPIILKWKNKASNLPNIVHIHGTKDRLLLPGYVKANYWVKDAGHFMVWNRAKEVSIIINKILSNQPAL